MLNITKDGIKLSEKQMFHLKKHKIDDVSKLTYKECSEKISEYIKEYKLYKENMYTEKEDIIYSYDCPGYWRD